MLDGGSGPATDVAVLGAAAALYAADLVDGLPDGLAAASEAVTSGAARDVRDRWVTASQDLATGT